ncbi:MAG: DUF4956 domain-containing protein [Gemmatimonadetes bacterium]|nr:DUF4956 domain-containing protein [Gemmatimonadota bacterium]
MGRVARFAQLLGFYLLTGTAVYALVDFIPSMRALVASHGRVPAAVRQFGAAVGDAAQAGGADATAPPTWAVALTAMLASLVLAAPVAWTYVVTRGRQGSRGAVVKMIVMLPVAVAAVVLVVFGDLALAFALAGIVAAVRFRTTLEDVRDGVFAFVAIGIGIAAGTQAWLLAGLLSLVFSLLALALWELETRRRSGGGPPSPQTLGQALAPGGADLTVTMGEPGLVAPLRQVEQRAVPPLAERLAQYVKADALRPKGRFRELLLLHAMQAGDAQSAVENTLTGYARRWRLVDTFPGREGTLTLEYLIRLKKKAEVGGLLDHLRAKGGVRAIEITSLAGRRRGRS